MQDQKILLVAKVTKEVAEEIGSVFQDVDGNYIISLCLAQYLEMDDFKVIWANYDANLGTLPVLPGNPIIRPKNKS